LLNQKTLPDPITLIRRDDSWVIKNLQTMTDLWGDHAINRKKLSALLREHNYYEFKTWHAAAYAMQSDGLVRATSYANVHDALTFLKEGPEKWVEKELYKMGSAPKIIYDRIKAQAVELVATYSYVTSWQEIERLDTQYARLSDLCG